MITVEPATESLLRSFYGREIPRTVRALVGLDDGRPIGCAGLYLDGAQTMFFSDMSDEARKYPIRILKAAREVLKGAAPGVPIRATADPEIEASGRFLEHLGFRPMGDGWYEC